MSIVYFKFRAQLAYETILFDGHFISVGELKRLICQKKSMGDALSELVLSNPKTNQEYREDSEQIAKGSHVLIRRVPAQNKSRVLVGATPVPQLPARASAPLALGQPISAAAAGASAAGPSATTDDDFGADPFAQSAANLQQEMAAARNLALVAGVTAGGDSKQTKDRPSWGLGGRGGPAGRGGRGRCGPAYNCRRCGEVGKHWEKDCPTVGDPAYDFKTVRMPTGIPVTKLSRNADGSLFLPTGELGELAPNQLAFQQQIALMTGAAAKPEAEAGQSADQTNAVPLLIAPSDKPKDASPARSASPAAAAKAEQPAASKPEPDLFEDDELDHSAAPIRISVTPAAVSEREQPSAARSNGLVADAETTEADSKQAAKDLWTYHALLKDVLPPRMDLLQCVEAFGTGRALSEAEFLRFQREHSQAVAPQQQVSRSRSRSRERDLSRSRSARGREDSPRRMPHASQRRPVDDVRQEEQPKKAKSDTDRQRADTGHVSSALHRQRSRTFEEASKLDEKQANGLPESAGRKRHRANSYDEFPGKLEDQDRYHHGLSDTKYARPSPEHASQLHSTEGTTKDALSDDSRERGEQSRRHSDDGKKHKKKSKKHKKHKEHKDKEHKEHKEHKARHSKKERKHRDSSPEEQQRSRHADDGDYEVDLSDRYVPEDFDGPVQTGQQDPHYDTGPSSRQDRRYGQDREPVESYDDTSDRVQFKGIPDRMGDKPAPRPEKRVPGGLMFQKALSSVGTSNDMRRR